MGHSDWFRRTLLVPMLAECPDRIQTAAAHEQRAECLVRLGDWAGAVDAFRAAMAAERLTPNVRTDAYLEFAFLVVTTGKRDLFDEAARVAGEHAGETRPFPVQLFKWHVIDALLCHEAGAHARAREHARAALDAARARHSEFRYHAALGLVDEMDPAVEDRLRTLAGLDDA